MIQIQKTILWANFESPIFVFIFSMTLSLPKMIHLDHWRNQEGDEKGFRPSPPSVKSLGTFNPKIQAFKRVSDLTASKGAEGAGQFLSFK